MEDKLLTETEVADMLGVSKATLQRWRRERAGGPPFHHIGRAIRYTTPGVRKWINDNEATA